MKCGIAFIEFNLTGYTITGWVKDDKGNDLVWDDVASALEALDIEYGWIGYVRTYPDGGKPSPEHKW